MERRRADILLVERGLCATRAKARAAIEAGGVYAAGRRVAKPSELVSVTAELEAQAAHPWVSRAGVKLAHALDVFDVDPAGRACVDLGASTGGFVEVLLARAAAHVTAVDVGTDQLHPSLRQNDRVAAREGLDARALTPDDLPAPPTLITCDASFIGLEKLLPAALACAAPGADLVALFKPQFEVGPAHVGKGGIVRDRAAVHASLARLDAWLETRGWPARACAPSPIRGGDGNAEILLWATARPPTP